MARRAILAAFGSGLAAVLFASAAHAQFSPAPPPDAGPEILPQDIPPPPPTESLLTGEELEALFSGADFEGCYPDGSSWAERTADDGALYDLLQGAALVGSWWVEENLICYYYDAQDVTACWTAIRRNGEYYFFFPGTGLIGGTTDCGVPIA